MSELNPKIREVKIGTRTLRPLTIYPLSMSNQFDLTEIVVAAIVKFSDAEKETLVVEMVAMIKENLKKILGYVSDEKPEDVFDELTNAQALEIATVIYQVNYESEIKNVQDLIKTVKQSLLMRSSQQ